MFALFVTALPVVEARETRSSGGGSRSSGGTVKRSPSTGSKISRPTSKPAPQPASRPASRPAQSTRPTAKPDSKPAPRPETKPASRPETKPAPRPDPKPVTRPDTKPATRPETKPATRPSVERPSTRPDNSLPNAKPDGNRPGRPDNNLPNTGRPGNGDGNGNGNAGGNRPDTRPDTRPGNNNGSNRPDSKPNYTRPNNNKPATLPGMVSYPDRPSNSRPNRPGNNVGNGNGNGNNVGNGSGNNIVKGGGNNNVKGGDRNNGNTYIKGGDRNTNVHIDKVNVNRRNNGLNRPATLPVNNRNWNSNKWGGNKSVWGNNNTININNNVKINNNYRNNYNYAYRPNCWGARPWWGASSYHTWHHGSWNYGYNSRWYSSHYYYNDNDFARGFMWGIGVWSLGNLIYDMGYQSYRNPYPAPPVQSGDSKTTIVYTQPISVSAAENPPGDEEAVALAETKSNEALARSRTAFKNGDYVTALKADEEALGYTPGDTTLHEYRALCLFALGKYGEAAGVLNPVLASGPGWGWDTLVDFYPSSSVYDEQLRKLEAYVKGTPGAADGHFLLGYQYLVCGYTDKAYEQFSKAYELQPADSISRQLRDLMKDSLPDDGDSEAEPPAAPAPVPSEKLVGNWVASPASGGKITFKMEESGDFVWTFVNGDKTSELKGTYGLDDKGLLVLTTEDTQMVSSIALPQESELKFTLLGSPDGDPGLDFKKG